MDTKLIKELVQYGRFLTIYVKFKSEDILNFNVEC